MMEFPTTVVDLLSMPPELEAFLSSLNSEVPTDVPMGGTSEVGLEKDYLTASNQAGFGVMPPPEDKGLVGAADSGGCISATIHDDNNTTVSFGAAAPQSSATANVGSSSAASGLIVCPFRAAHDFPNTVVSTGAANATLLQAPEKIVPARTSSRTQMTDQELSVAMERMVAKRMKRLKQSKLSVS